MIVSHRRKEIVLCIPKTGSTTLGRLIDATEIYSNTIDICNGSKIALIEEKMPADLPKYDPTDPNRGVSWLDREQSGTVLVSRHATLEEYVSAKILTEEQVADYRVICMIRHPLDRWCSAYRHAAPNGISKARTRARWEKGAEMMPGEPRFNWPQTKHYFLNGQPAGTPMLYERFDEEISRFLTSLGADVPDPIPRLNARNPLGYTADDMLDRDIQAALLDLYADDLKEWNTLNER